MQGSYCPKAIRDSHLIALTDCLREKQGRRYQLSFLSSLHHPKCYTTFNDLKKKKYSARYTSHPPQRNYNWRQQLYLEASLLIPQALDARVKVLLTRVWVSRHVSPRQCVGPQHTDFSNNLWRRERRSAVLFKRYPLLPSSLSPSSRIFPCLETSSDSGKLTSYLCKK